MARARRPVLRRRARRARCRRHSTSRPAARTRTRPVELTPHYFSLPHRPSLPHFHVARIETDAPTLPPPPAYPATLLPLPILLPDPRRLPRHNQSLRRPGLEPVILPHLRRRAPWRASQHHGAPPRTHATCRRQNQPFLTPLTHSAAVTSTPPPFPPPLLLLPPLPHSDSCLPRPACTTPKSQSYEICHALARRFADRSTAVRTPPARVGAIRTHPRTRGCPLKAARVGATCGAHALRRPPRAH